MISSEVQRTLVKSPPELWTELSEPDALARHLGELGEIRITRTDPEKAVEWEAADTTGKVTLAPSGWGTKVTLSVTREPAEVESAAEPEPAVVGEPTPEPEPEPLPLAAEEALSEEHLEHQPRLGFFARLFRRRRQDQIDPEALQIVEPETGIEPEQPALEDTPAEEMQDIAAELKAAEEAETEQVTAVLTAVLDRLGAAHHRPFSRA
ncbi:MAG TPA: hypothetical protein VGH56_10000 [Solirubrobacteraceae bacterium]|jgi:hypothetical protein